MKRLVGYGLLFLLLVNLMGSVSAQNRAPVVPPDPPSIDERRPAGPQPPAGPAAKPAALPDDFRIGAGDILTVSVLGVPDLAKTVEVSASGKIILPYLEEVHVEGLTVPDLEKKLRTLFGAAIVKDPQVSVLVNEYQSQSITIIGEVTRPGTYQSRTKLSLINALSRAGWVTSNAGGKISVQRTVKSHASPTGTPSTADSALQTIEIDLKELLSGREGALNVPIQGGDLIQVSKKIEEAHFYYVLGGVNKPGAYTASEGLKLLEAMAVAGGLSPTAKRKKILISRAEADGTRVQMEANLEEILKGRKENLSIHEKDIVFIPDRMMKSFKGDALNSLLPGSLFSSLLYLLGR